MEPKLGICLAGGGARGIAHIGVLQALEEHGIQPQYISGASAGSIVGSLYAAGKKPGEILEIFKTTSLLKLFKPSLSTLGLTDLGNIKKILAEHIAIDSFEALDKKLFISVTNLSKGRYEIASQGPLFDLVVTSCSIPLLFTSRKIQQDIYVDGGVLNNLPVEPLKNHCDLTIGVNVTPINEEKDLSDALKIGVRIFDLIMWSSVESRLELCDVVIQPQSDNYHLFDVWKADEIFQQGYDAAQGQIPTLKTLLGNGQVSDPTNSASSLVTSYPQVMKKESSSAKLPKSQLEAASSSAKANLPPGTMVYIGAKRIGKPVVTVMEFTPEKLEEESNVSLERLTSFDHDQSLTWINLDGVHDLELVKGVGEAFSLHPLSLEDIVNTTQRPKVQFFDDYILVIVKSLRIGSKEGLVGLEQISMVLKKNVVLSFQEKTEDILDPLRNRIRQGRGRIRKSGTDYVFYAIFDAIVSNYFHACESLDEVIEGMEEKLYKTQNSEVLKEIQDMKNQVRKLHQAVSPLNATIKELIQADDPLISEDILPYFKDLQDQVYRTLDILDAHRDALQALRDQFMSLSDHKMNEIMKVLTIVATIFIPLTFIAGIYGMNFENIPELSWKNGYFYAWGLMIAITVGMLAFFRKKKWI